MNVVAGLLGQVVGLLRYVAAPVAAAFLVGAFDREHDVFAKATRAMWPSDQGPPIWIVGALTLSSGFLVYFLHRNLTHRLVQDRLCRSAGDGPRRVELDYARWMRRTLPECKPARAVQNALDNLNAAVDFFYCLTLCLIALPLAMATLFPGSVSLGATRGAGYVLVTLALGWIAVGAHRRAARYDVVAFERFGDVAQLADAAADRPPAGR